MGAQLKEQLRLDYIERFGCEPPSEEQKEREDVGKKTTKDQVLYWIQQMKKAHKDDPRLKTAYATLKIYAGNAQKDPTNPKFLQIKKENKAFQDRVAWCPEAIELLAVLGFKDNGDFFANTIDMRGRLADG